MTTAPTDAAAPPRPALALLTGAPGERHGTLRLLLWLGWLLAAGYLAVNHVVWRDEVRALTLALSGNGVGDMLWAIHGEGHPALWYLLLRGGYALTGTKAVLPVVAFLIAAAATALIAWRAPFRPLVIALVLFSAYALVDYAVVARNYGMAMLVMVAIAHRYPAGRERGASLGVLLFLLCNTNAPAVLLAGGVLLFWGVELLCEQGWRWTPAARRWLAHAAVTALGAAACAAMVYPPYNDAAQGAGSKEGLLPFALLSAGMAESWVGALLFCVILAGAVAGLARAPAALIASLAVMVGMGVFFHLVYPGLYRHQALVVVFLLAMYWLAANGRGGRWPAQWRWPAWRLERYSAAAFTGLLGLQFAAGLALFGMTAQGEPMSRSRDLGRLLAQPGLRDALVVGEPDVVLEPISYYAPNPTWFVRERRWGRVVAFTRKARRDVSLGEMLATARLLRTRAHRPVVIVLHDDLHDGAPIRYDQGYYGGFTSTPAEVRAFRAATRQLARFGPAQTDETYHVYLLT